MKNDNVIYNMIHEQNMIKCIAEKKDIKFSYFGSNLAAIFKWKAAILNDWHADEERYYDIEYDSWKKYDKMCCSEKGHQIFIL